jgi:hypothetical protein
VCAALGYVPGRVNRHAVKEVAVVAVPFAVGTLLWIIIIVLIVLLVLGVLGRGRF